MVDLRERVAAAFIAETGGETIVSEGGLVTVAARDPERVADGLDAARRVWIAAPFEVRVEVNQLNVAEGDTTMSYDLATVLPRATHDDAIRRAVAKANR